MVSSSKGVHIIITGGTIDSVFDGRKDAVVVNDHSVIPAYLQEVIQPHFQISTEVVTLKDSRQITDHTRADIVQAIVRARSDSVIITHGTYTMADSAAYLAERRSDFAGKRVVLTGSFFPLKNFAEGDAGFNLGFAIAAAVLCAPGVYLAMNGELFPAGESYKNLERGRFEKVKSS